MQENYILSRKYSHLRNIYIRSSSRPYVHSRKLYYWALLHSRNSRNIYSEIVPSHFMIIKSFTITIPLIKYSYNFSSVEGWRNCWYDRGFRNMITVRVVFATIVRRNTTRSASRVRHYIFTKIWYVRQQAVYIERNCWAFYKLWVLAQDIPLSFFLKVVFIDKTYQYPNALRYLRIDLSLNADVSENTLPLVSQSINNFSDYDISHTHDWECPSLSPHVFVLIVN